MTGFSRIERLFHDACELPPEARRDFLLHNEADPDIRAEVEKLLSNDDNSGNPFAQTLHRVMSASMQIPQWIGRYRIIEPLGEGGMARVFLAERDIDGRAQRVALKLISGSASETFRRKAIRERTLLAALNHRGIAGFIDSGETRDGVLFLVMEYVEGIPLPEFLESKHPPVHERLKLFRQICDAIEHAHQRLILHLDLKPSNVLVRSDGSISLIDFGIGREVEEDAQHTQAGAYTPIYAAPEQRAGENPTTTTDVYAAGLLLFEMLSNSGLSERKRRKQTTAIADVLAEKDTRTSIPTDLRRVIAYATETHASDRYPSIAALRTDIDHFLAGRMLSASRQAWWVRSGKFCRRNLWPLATAAMFTLLVGTFVLQLSKERTRALAAEKNALVAQDMQASVLLALSPPGNPQAQAKIQELLRSERLSWEKNTDQRMLDSTWRSVASVVTVAEIYALIGDPEPALKTADAALRMINQMDAIEKNQYPSLLARTHAARAQSLNDLERFDEAKNSFQKMLQIRKSRSREDRTGLLRALMQYANAAIGWNEYALAEKLLKQAQNIVDRDQDTATEDRIGLAIKSLNLSTQDESTPIAGEKKLNSLLALANKTLTPDAHDWIEVWMVISTFHYRYGRYDDALKYIDKALYKSRAIYGERSTITANGLSFRAALLNDLGRHREALDNFDSLRAIQVSIRPDKAPLIAKIDGQRGGTLMLMGEFEKAAQASEAAIRGLLDTTPNYLRWRAIAMSNLARSQSRLGKHTEAVAAADRLMASLDSLPLSALDRAMASMSLSGIWLAAGRFDRVQFALDRAETGFRKLLPADHPGFIQVTQRRGELAEAQNNFAQAERHYSTALKLLDRSQDNPSLRRDLMCSQVRVIYRLGDQKRAEQLSRQTLAVVHAQVPLDTVFLGETREMLRQAGVSRRAWFATPRRSDEG